ncbi:MAG: hypothetical protein KF786_14060 [Burkholderiaceae bacterium]|nr:hypothetical protein [Burkholderiaceae bacterium]
MRRRRPNPDAGISRNRIFPMNPTENEIPRSLRLKAGDWVVVRDAAEILSTLDEDGCLDRLPFMPEMLAHCGKRYRVRAVAHKTCDTIEATGGRRMHDTVHLDDLRCDGSAHGGCEAGCTLFWKEAWLRRDSQAARPAIAPAAGSFDVLQRACTREGSVPDDPTWRCQTTDLLKASEPLRPTEVGQYVRDVTTGNHGVFDVLRLLMLAGYERLVNVGVGYRVWSLHKRLAACFESAASRGSSLDRGALWCADLSIRGARPEAG